MANMNLSKNITIIPARKRVGNTVAKEEIPNSELQPIAVFLQIQRNRLQVMRHRWSIIQII